ncbi:hypothetical protein [Streptomyces sp. NPDC090029]|uniref:hypothetical protein n=1 Tax=Streptomyces sp. NPDC090029 TaxID=3365924 RepID=UPI0038230BF0
MANRSLIALMAVLGLALWTVVGVGSIVLMVKGCLLRAWARPRWWVQAACAFTFTGTVAWLSGLFSQSGLTEKEDACRLDGADYDSGFAEARSGDSRHLFPLHDWCSAHHDLVPAWVNPTVVICAALALLAVLGAVWVAIDKRTRS